MSDDFEHLSFPRKSVDWLREIWCRNSDKVNVWCLNFELSPEWKEKLNTQPSRTWVNQKESFGIDEPSRAQTQWGTPTHIFHVIDLWTSHHSYKINSCLVRFDRPKNCAPRLNSESLSVDTKVHMRILNLILKAVAGGVFILYQSS